MKTFPFEFDICAAVLKKQEREHLKYQSPKADSITTEADVSH